MANHHLSPLTLLDQIIANRPFPNDAQKSFDTCEGEIDILYNPASPLPAGQIAEHLIEHAARYRTVTFTCTNTEFADCEAMEKAIAAVVMSFPAGSRLPFMGIGPSAIIRLYRYNEVTRPEHETTFGEALLARYLPEDEPPPGKH